MDETNIFDIMGFITLLSQLPIENTFVNKNILVVVLGLLIYMAIGALIYTDRFPVNILSSIPDRRYLLLVVALDIALFICIYRFQNGELPSFSNMTEKSTRISDTNTKTHHDKILKFDHTDGTGGTGGDQMKVGIKNQVGGGKASKNNAKNVSFNDVVDDASSWANGDVNIDNDLESTFKRPGIHSQPELPEEVSIPGGNYFNEDGNRTKVENWELDEYTNSEFDQSKEHMMID